MNSINSFPITDWAEDDRPREKLMSKGVASLSNAELLAIIMRSGSTEDNAVELARKILADFKNNLNELIIDLKKHRNEADYFYQIRSLDRNKNYAQLSNIEKASRIIYLNKTCYNGLYRVNNAGEFNAPFGRYTNPNIINEPTLKAVHKYLNSIDISIMNIDYEIVLKDLNKNSFVYLDPPYHPVSETSFTGYIQGGWNIYDQVRLRDACNELNEKGIKFLQSNSATDFIFDLYKEYNIKIIKANRFINSNGKKRGEVDEVLIRNYE